MGAWTISYENLPKNFNNPGYGASAFRSLKVSVRERGEIEHIWGTDEATLGITGGTHKEGSARALVLDDSYTEREAESKVATEDVGRLRIDVQELGSVRTQGGEATWAGRDPWLAERVLSLEVIADEDGAVNQPGWHQLFASDNYVDIYHDQEIKGDKTFESSPKVPIIDPLLFEPGATPSADQALFAVPLTSVKDRLNEGKFHNPFDSNDADNIANAAAETDYNIRTIVIESTDYDIVDEDISVSAIVAETIVAESISGAVWI